MDPCQLPPSLNQLLFNNGASLVEKLISDSTSTVDLFRLISGR
jgi:hypothetical protein